LPRASLGRTPFDSITLAENGYTVKQITSKVSLAKQYNPKTISIMAGTNDVFHPRYRLDETLLDFKEMLDAAQDVSDSCIVTLPPLTRIPSASESIAELNSRIKPLIQNSKCRIIDLNPFLAPNGILLDQYTTDGVHLSPKAYDEWARQLKAVLN
jgi:lysophospholipase L1-like esterase